GGARVEGRRRESAGEPAAGFETQPRAGDVFGGQRKRRIRRRALGDRGKVVGEDAGGKKAGAGGAGKKKVVVAAPHLSRRLRRHAVELVHQHKRHALTDGIGDAPGDLVAIGGGSPELRKRSHWRRWFSRHGQITDVVAGTLKAKRPGAGRPRGAVINVDKST